MANAVAAQLRRRGFSTGDPAAIFLPNIPQFAIVYLGIVLAGGIAVSLNTTLKTDEVAFILNDCKPMVVFTTSQALTKSGQTRSRNLNSPESSGKDYSSDLGDVS